MENHLFREGSEAEQGKSEQQLVYDAAKVK